MIQPQKVRHKKSDGTRFNAHLSIERAAIFSPLGKKHKNPQCTHCDSSSSIGKWISRTQTLVPLRAREGNQSDRCFFLFFSFFPRKFIRIVSLINLRHNQGRDRVFRGKKEETPRDFPVSRALRSKALSRWRPMVGGLDHLAVTTIVRRRCY